MVPVSAVWPVYEQPMGSSVRRAVRLPVGFRLPWGGDRRRGARRPGEGQPEVGEPDDDNEGGEGSESPPEGTRS